MYRWQRRLVDCFLPLFLVPQSTDVCELIVACLVFWAAALWEVPRTRTASANSSFRIRFSFTGAGESQNAIILNSGHSGFRTAVIISAWLWN
jgi:hypothetical protein